jgi:hypothetical protein
MLNGDNGEILPMKMFGFVYFVKDNRPSVGKIDPRAVKYVCGIFGYSEGVCLLEPSRETVVCEHGCTFLRVRAMLYT